MSTTNVKQVAATLERLFQNKIDMSDVEFAKADERAKMFFTRALAAYSLYVIAETSVDVAAQSITDGFDDMGVDAVHFDRKRNVLWFVQSKWMLNGSGEPKSTDLSKYRKGIELLIEPNFEEANEKIRAKKSDLIDAIHDASVQHRYVVAYTGSPLTKRNQNALDRFEREQNDISDFARFEVFHLRQIWESLPAAIEGRGFNADVCLYNWGKFDGPYTAFYGHVSGEDVAKWWVQRRNRLFSQNIRAFLGSTDVNKGIRGSLANEPETLWYFHNGITVLCDRIEKKSIGGRSTASGYFECYGMSIVNGIQTVGTIGEAFLETPKSVQDAQLLVKLISLEGCPPEFGKQVTKATNTQNLIEVEDFVSLDHHQQRLRMEMMLNGKTYHIQRASTDTVTCDAKHCTLAEATRALACASPDPVLAVSVKTNIETFWDMDAEPYTTIFNESTTGTKAWRAVAVVRAILELRSECGNGDRLFDEVLTHGDMFISHIAFRLIPDQLLDDKKFDFETFEASNLPDIVRRAVDTTISEYKRKVGRRKYHQPKRIFHQITGFKELRAMVLQSKEHYWSVLADMLGDEHSMAVAKRNFDDDSIRLDIELSICELLATLDFKKNAIAIELRFMGPKSAASFDLLLDDKERIENEIGSNLDWHSGNRRRQCHVRLVRDDVDPTDRNSWKEQHAWFVEYLRKFRGAFFHRVRELEAKFLQTA